MKAKQCGQVKGELGKARAMRGKANGVVIKRKPEVIRISGQRKVNPVIGRPGRNKKG